MMTPIAFAFRSLWRRFFVRVKETRIKSSSFPPRAAGAAGSHPARRLGCREALPLAMTPVQDFLKYNPRFPVFDIPHPANATHRRKP
jgi:hypothetical protein